MNNQTLINILGATSVALLLGLLAFGLASILKDDTALCSKPIKEVVLDTPTSWCSVSEDGINFRYVDKNREDKQ